MNKRSIGTEYEQFARDYLEKHGVKILEQNYRNRSGEIDLIGRDGEYTVFIEVKYRSTSQNGHPLEAVTYSKQKQISKVADYYRIVHKLSEFIPMRFDVIAILGDEITWVKNAFYYQGRYK